jgi:hypothetical protein
MSTGRLFALPLVFLVLAACDIGGTPQPSPAAKAWPTGSPLAVYDGRVANGSGHTVSVVSFDNAGGPNATAKVLATATLAERTGLAAPTCPGGSNCTGRIDLPMVSTSKSHIYVLDGDTTVKLLAPGGSLTKVTSIPGTAHVHAAFAVSPDDSQIAVGTIDFADFGFRVYVENLHGGGHVDLFYGGVGPFYWPIGWHAGKVVLAAGFLTTWLNPYETSGYALVDPIAKAQPVAMGKFDCIPSGTLTVAGTACIARPGTQCLEDPVSNATSTYYYSCLRRVGWSGSETNFLLPSNSYTSAFTVSNAALSPDGQVIITDQLGRVLAPLSDTHGGNSFLGSSSASVQSNLRLGWISNELFSTTVISSDGNSTQSILALNPPDYNAIHGVPFAGAAPTVGSLVGTLPGGL